MTNTAHGDDAAVFILREIVNPVFDKTLLVQYLAGGPVLNESTTEFASAS